MIFLKNIKDSNSLIPLSVFDTLDTVADNPAMLAISAYLPLDLDAPTSSEGIRIASEVYMLVKEREYITEKKANDVVIDRNNNFLSKTESKSSLISI